MRNAQSWIVLRPFTPSPGRGRHRFQEFGHNVAVSVGGAAQISIAVQQNSNARRSFVALRSALSSLLSSDC